MPVRSRYDAAGATPILPMVMATLMLPMAMARMTPMAMARMTPMAMARMTPMAMHDGEREANVAYGGSDARRRSQW